MGIYSAEGPDGPIHRVQALVEGAVAPLQMAGVPLGEAVEAAEDSGSDNAASEATLTALREQNEQLVAQLTSSEEIRLENERLRGLLNLRDVYDIRGVAGRVIGRSTDAWNQDITLDVGSSSGVETGLTVMGPTGVVGQVISVSAGSCRVRLLTDPQSGAAAMIQVGDVVLTSGLGGSYTRGLVIGTVARVEGSAGKDTRKIVVAPNGSVSLMEEAIVVFSAAEDASDRSIPAPSDQAPASGADNTGEGGQSDGDGNDDGAEGGSGDGGPDDAAGGEEDA